MRALTRWTPLRAGIRDILRSDGVRQDLERRAQRVQRVAAPRFAAEQVTGDPVKVVADSYTGRNRAGATVIAVHPSALAIEKERRILGGAIDAAGG